MARCIRRALSARSLLPLRAPRHSCNPSPLAYSISTEAAAGAPALSFRGGFDRTGSDPFFETRRGFAKGRKPKNEDDGDTIQVVPDIGPTVKSTTLSQMEAAIVALSRELGKLRTGRASAGMLDHIIVETSSAKMPLNHVAVVSVLDAHTLSVTPYDPNVLAIISNSAGYRPVQSPLDIPCGVAIGQEALKALEHAIISSPLGLNPTADGSRLIAAIPPLTKENMQALCKVVAKCAEDVKQSIRRARQKALDSIKKAASSIPKDDTKRLEKEVEEMTKRFVKSADDMCKAKEKEISSS